MGMSLSSGSCFKMSQGLSDVRWSKLCDLRARVKTLSAKLQVVVPSVMSAFNTTLQRLFPCQHRWTGLRRAVSPVGKVSDYKGYIKFAPVAAGTVTQACVFFPSMPPILAAPPCHNITSLQLVCPFEGNKSPGLSERQKLEDVQIEALTVCEVEELLIISGP